MRSATTSIDAYINEFPAETQKLLQQMRSSIRAAAPQAIEAISYAVPTFKLNGNLVHFAGYKNHIGFYPGTGAIKEFETELAAFETSKGTVQFPIDKPLPLKLVEKITKFRVMQNLAKAKAKK